MMSVWIKERENCLKTNLKRMQIRNSGGNAFTIQIQRDNRYLLFHEHLCRFNQNKINCIIESAF